mgnify:FL=1
MFEEKFNGLSSSAKRQFAQYMNELLFTTFIVRKKYDRATGISKTTQAYLFIETYFDIFENYLAFAGLNLNKDDDYGIIFINSPDGENRLRLDGVTTLLVYALRFYYEDALKLSSSQTDVLIDSASLKLLIKDLGLNRVNKRISSLTIANALRFLSSHNIIARAKNSFSDSSYSFYILPSIRYVIDPNQMNSLLDEINSIDGSNNSGNGEVENDII